MSDISTMLYSTDDIWLGEDTNKCLTDAIDDIYKITDFLPDNYAAKSHEHPEYATVENLASKANADHNHDDVYYKKSEVDEIIASLRAEMADMIEKAMADKTDESGTTDADTADSTDGKKSETTGVTESESKTTDSSSDTEGVSE